MVRSLTTALATLLLLPRLLFAEPALDAETSFALLAPEADEAPALLCALFECEEPCGLLPLDQRVRHYLTWADIFRAEGYDAALSLEIEQMALAFYDHAGQEPSLETLEKLLRDFPHATFLRNGLAWTTLIYRNDPELALTQFRGAARCIASLDTLAWIYLALGRKADALQAILEALELAKEEETESGQFSTPLLYDHAGDIFFRNRLFAPAATAWAYAQGVLKRLAAELNLPPEDVADRLGYNDAFCREKYKAIRTLFPDL